MIFPSINYYKFNSLQDQVWLSKKTCTISLSPFITNVALVIIDLIHFTPLMNSHTFKHTITHTATSGP